MKPNGTLHNHEERLLQLFGNCLVRLKDKALRSLKKRKEHKGTLKISKESKEPRGPSNS